MSTEPEDLLEEALRSDLPSKETEARLRRRLLGAGLAVSNGIAATTAAAAGAAGASATAGGATVLVKAATLSWGFKLGVAAAIAIPTVGLWWERSDDSAPAAATPPTAVAGTPTQGHREDAARAERVGAAQVQPPAEPTSSAPRASVTPRRAEPSVLAAAPSAAPAAMELPPPEPAAKEPRAASTLGEETRLLDRAFAELAAGHGAAAAQLVAEHEFRYPQGLLVKERERAKVKLSELSRGE
jgi:hypothetical protein